MKKCDGCGKKIKGKIYEVDSFTQLCEKCWDKECSIVEARNDCAYCDNYQYSNDDEITKEYGLVPLETEYFILNKEDAKQQEMKIGLYKILNYPYYSNNWTCQYIYKEKVKFIKKVNSEESGKICEICLEELLT